MPKEMKIIVVTCKRRCGRRSSCSPTHHEAPVILSPSVRQLTETKNLRSCLLRSAILDYICCRPLSGRSAKCVKMTPLCTFLHILGILLTP
jgi:hypothetical protein